MHPVGEGSNRDRNGTIVKIRGGWEWRPSKPALVTQPPAAAPTALQSAPARPVLSNVDLARLVAHLTAPVPKGRPKQ